LRTQTGGGGGGGPKKGSTSIEGGQQKGGRKEGWGVICGLKGTGFLAGTEVEIREIRTAE